jgi:hypothetical protein
LKEDTYDISESEGKEASHFQVDQALQFAQLDKKFEPRITKLFKQEGPSIKLDIKEVILLDSQSTMDLLCNAALLRKISKSKSSMRIKSNGGTMVVTRKATMEGYNKTVWSGTRAITNIIALHNFIYQYRITYDSDDLMFVVHWESESKPNMEFKMHNSGLHYYDPRKEHQLAFFNTVSENKTGFTKRQIKCAEIARNLYKTLSYPSIKDFKWVVRSNKIKEFPVTIQEIDVAMKIRGKNISAMKGKNTLIKTHPVARDYVKVPKELLKLHKEVFMTTHIFFMNTNLFLVTLSCKICFTAVNHLADRTVPQIFKAFKEMYQYYLQRGFGITTVHADGEFPPLKTLIEAMPGGTVVNLASANEHVPEIERRILVVNEWCRATWHRLPFHKIPKLMRIHIVLNVVKLLNFFLTKGGVSDTLIPKTIMSKGTLGYKQHLSLQLGQYCQVHEEDNPRNSQIARTKGAISLGPSSNLQGGFNVMALNSGKKIVHCSWDVIPMHDLVIDWVNALGRDQPQHMTFNNKNGRLIGDVEIPGVDAEEDNDDHLSGVVPVIAYGIDITGVDVEGTETQDAVPAPQVKIDDIDIHHADPAPIEVAPTQEEPRTETPAPVALLAQAPELHRSTRVRSQTNQGYTPSLSGSKYAYAATQLESQGALNPDSHMFMQEDFYSGFPSCIMNAPKCLLDASV